MKANNNIMMFDLETGGLHPTKNPIVEIGWVVLDADLNEIDSYQDFVQVYDGLELNPKAMEVNGIQMKDINSGISKNQLIANIKRAIKKYSVRGRQGKIILSGHNITNFDIGFVEYLIPDLMKLVNPMPLDTLWLARLSWGRKEGAEEMANYQLSTCCERIGVDITNAHRALNDARGNAELLRYFVGAIRNEQVIINTSQNNVKEKKRHSFKF